MIALLFAMVCGILIYSIRLKQLNTGTRIKFENVQIIERSFIDYGTQRIEVPGSSGTEQLEIPRVHYPKPQTFSR